jgi:hypothetical protein
MSEALGLHDDLQMAVGMPQGASETIGGINSAVNTYRAGEQRDLEEKGEQRPRFQVQQWSRHPQLIRRPMYYFVGASRSPAPWTAVKYSGSATTSAALGWKKRRAGRFDCTAAFEPTDEVAD